MKIKGGIAVFLVIALMGAAWAFIPAAANEKTSDEDAADVIEQIKEQLDIELTEADAQKLVETMEKLEDMGFSVEYVLEKTENLYKEYGAEFVDHVEETVTGAVKNTLSGAASSFFNHLANSVKDFFTGLFS